MPSAENLTETGVTLYKKGDAVGARLHYLAALGEDSGYLPALRHLGQLANDANELDAAVAFVHKILHQVPCDGIQWSNLGNLLMRQERFDEAVGAMERAAIFAPDVPTVWHNFALLYLRMRYYESALDCIERAERLGSRELTVQNDKAHVFLYLGRLAEAWPLYEARWNKLAHLPPWDFHVPEWQGEDLSGKTILVHSEQGFGDSIMWLRFTSFFTNIKLTLGVPRCLESLVKYLGHNVLAIEDMNAENMAKFDFQSPMYSALRWLGEIEILPTPYIHIPVSPRDTGPLRIGLCWASGRRNSEHDFRGRYTDFRDWLKFVAIPGVELVSLQQGRDADDIASHLCDGLIEDRAITQAKDWLDTAQIIAGLDLVISVDTAVAHLAGAMGKPIWMLAQYTNCWRWWDIENGTGKPWYKTMRIFRQPKPGDWKTPLQDCLSILVQKELERGTALAA